MDELRTELQERFGWSDWRPGQETVVRALLEGRSALALFPTGAGKSLCYQFPALLREGVALVISPLIALMKDQVESLQRRGIRAARLDSTLSAQESAGVLEALVGGGLDLLYIAPERLLKESFIERLKRSRIALMAVDEAHCISEWGHNFRPEYLRLAHVARQLNIHPVLALTATATPEVAQSIRRAFHIADQDHVQTSFRRPNLAYRVTPCSAESRLQTLTQRLKAASGASIVYVTLQQTAEAVATHLQQQGLRARAYHAGMNPEHRTEAQDAFMRGEIDSIVATIAFGMGIDKADIRAVYHYNLPKTIENYQQETGRAGRDGASAHCELFACLEDVVVLENFIYGDMPTAAALRSLIDHLLRQGEDFDVSMYELSQATDIRPLVIETVLTHLELDGLLSPLGSFYSTYQVRLLQPEERLLAGHTMERQVFLRKLFHSGKRGYQWITLQMEASAQQLGESKERILKALHWLEEAGDIELKPSGIRQRFRLLPSAQEAEPTEIAQDMVRRFTEREQRDLQRLQQVLEFAAHPGCLTRWLLHYFGETMTEDCGQCESCLHPVDEARVIPGLPPQSWTDEELAAVRMMLNEKHPALRGKRALARFFCGLSSPATTRARLTRHEYFACLTHRPFREVLELMNEMVG